MNNIAFRGIDAFFSMIRAGRPTDDLAKPAHLQN
jgi:hypothetical protein